jgi:ankyrin repeat protein
MDRITDRAQAFANRPKTPALTTNTYIEIPEYIKTYRALIDNSGLFNTVKQQYLYVLDQLAETCQPFAAECNHCGLDPLIGYTKKLLTDIDIEDISSSTDRDLFFSYTSIRQALIEIEEFLRTSDDEDKKITVYSQLFDGFGVCLQGFNGKVYDVYQYMQRQETSKQDINHELYSKCNLLIKDEVYKLLPVLQEEQILERYLIGDEIHVTNSMIEVAYNKLNLTEDVDSQFVVYDAVAKDLTRYQKKCILSRLDYPLTRYKMITFITKMFSKDYNSIMDEVAGISEWHTREVTSSELTAEYTDKIDLYFCSLINKYFNIQDASQKFSISTILEGAKVEGGKYSFANIKDTLHKFIATNIDKFPHNMLKDTFNEDLEFNTITKEGESYSIKSLNSGYFYKTDSNGVDKPISVDDLYSFVDTDIPLISKVPDELKVPIIMQALENKDSDEKIIYAFFNDINNTACLKQNKYVMKELLSSILSSETVKQKISDAIDLSYIRNIQYGNKSNAQCAIFFIKMGFISDNELYNSLVRRGKINLKAIIEDTLPRLLYTLLSNISTDNLKKLVASITTEDSFIDKFEQVFEQCLQQKNFSLLNTIFESDILLTKFLHTNYFKANKEEFLCLLCFHKQSKLLGRILSNSSITFKDFVNRSILHYAAFCCDKQILEKIIAKLSQKEIQEYLINKDIDGITPLSYAADAGNTTFFEILAPCMTEKIILATVGYTSYDYNALMCVVANGFGIATQLMKRLTINDIKSMVSSSGSNLLMIACMHANENFMTTLLSMEGIDDKYITRTNMYNHNVLTLAIKINNYSCAQSIINHCKDRKLFVIDIGSGKIETNLSYCFFIKDSNLRMQFFNLLFEFYKKDFPKGKNSNGFSLLHEAINSGNLDVLKEILPYCDKQMLTATIGDTSITPLRLALKNNKKDIIPILLPYYNEIDMLKSPKLHPKDTLISLMKQDIELTDNLLNLFNETFLAETTEAGNNLLMLAVLAEKTDWIKKLLVKCNEETILTININDNNILTLAMSSNNLDVVNCILDNLSLKTLENIYLQNNSQQNNILLSINSSLITKEIILAVLAKLTEIKNS